MFCVFLFYFYDTSSEVSLMHYIFFKILFLSWWLIYHNSPFWWILRLFSLFSFVERHWLDFHDNMIESRLFSVVKFMNILKTLILLPNFCKMYKFLLLKTLLRIRILDALIVLALAFSLNSILKVSIFQLLCLTWFLQH